MSYIGSKPADAVLETNDIADGVVTNPKLSTGSQQNFRNIIINGSMDIAQRGTSFSGGTSSIYTLDRFQLLTGSSFNFDVTATQDTDIPTDSGFKYSLKLDVDTAQTPSSIQNALIGTKLERQNINFLNYGSSNAKSLTLSFWVKSNKTGTYCIQLQTNAGGGTRYNYIAEYTISSSDTWEKKTITISGNTTFGFDVSDNADALRVKWVLACGSDDYETADNWHTSTAFSGTSNQVNFFDSTSNYINITGVQLEAGTTASDFEFLPVDVNLARCQRYYHEQGRTTTGNNYEGFCTITAYSGTSSRGIFYLPTTMRSIPSFSSNGNFALIGGSAGSVTAIALADGGGNPAVALNITASSMTAGNGFQLRSNNDADAVFKFDSEL